MISRCIASLFLACTIATPLAAQDGFLSAVEYTVGIPVGDTHGFSAAGSWSGGAWDGRWIVRPRTSVGALIGFSEFYHRQSGTSTFPGGAVTGDQYRHLLTAPILATAAWYFTSNPDDPRWYLGGGGGLQYTEQFFQLGTDARRRVNWNLVLVPEIGLAFPAWYGEGMIVGLRYHLPSESSAFLGDGQRRFQYLSLSIGFGYR